MVGGELLQKLKRKRAGNRRISLGLYRGRGSPQHLTRKEFRNKTKYGGDTAEKKTISAMRKREGRFAPERLQQSSRATD